MLIKDSYASIEDIPKEPWVKYYRKKENKNYILKPGMKAIVDPVSKSKPQEKFRGRKCIVLWIGCVHICKAGIRYLDTGHYGERHFDDLIPLPAEIVDLSKKRSEKQSVKISDSDLLSESE